MLSFKKLTKYAAISGLAFGLVFGTASIPALAADDQQQGTESGSETQTSKIAEINYETQELIITTSSDNTQTLSDTEPHYVYVGIVKGEDASKIKTFERIAVQPEAVTTKTDGVPSTTYIHRVRINIAAYTNTNKYTIQVYTDKNPEKETLTLGEQTKKLKASFVGNTKTLTLKSGEKELDYQYKTLYSAEWKDAEEFGNDVESFTTYGATLVVRQKSTAGTPYSKEVKVKIPKKANGPKATINPTKDCITIPANAEWRIVGSTKLANDNDYIWTPGEWIKAETKKSPKYLSELQKEIEVKANTPAGQSDSSDNSTTQASILSESVYIEFRTAANETKKKMESKVSFIELKARQTAPTDKDFTVTDIKKGEDVIGKKITAGSKALVVAIVERGKTFDYSQDSISKLKKIGAGKSINLKEIDGKDLIIMFAGVAAKPKATPVVEMQLISEGLVYPVNYEENGGSDTPAVKTTLTITSADNKTTLLADDVESVQLTATLDPTDDKATITWTSSDATKAKVNSTGKVTALAAGSVTITAEATLADGTKVTGTFDITVN